MKIANRQARKYVETRTPFVGSNTRAEWATARDRRVYCVYSYKWWLLYLYDEEADVWFENTESFSRTTSKHLSQCRPHNVETIKCDLRTIKDAVYLGVNAVVLRGEEHAVA